MRLPHTKKALLHFDSINWDSLYEKSGSNEGFYKVGDYEKAEKRKVHEAFHLDTHERCHNSMSHCEAVGLDLLRYWCGLPVHYEYFQP